DHVAVDGPRVHVATHDGRACTVSHLAGAFDAFVAELVELRARARRAALLQWTGDAPLVVVDAKRGTERVRVHVFPDAVTVEPLTGVPDMLPLSCVVALARDGYDLALRARGLPDVHVRHAGRRTDELVERIERALRPRRPHRDRLRAALPRARRPRRTRRLGGRRRRRRLALARAARRGRRAPPGPRDRHARAPHRR